MKLHINRKKRTGIKRSISMALVLCMLFTMDSSYVVAEASDMTGENQISGQTIAGTSLENGTEGTEGNTAQNAEQTTAGTETTTGSESLNENQDQNTNIDENQDPAQPPSDDQDPNVVQDPDAVQTPEETETPEAVRTPGEAQDPNAVQTPEEVGTPEAVQTPNAAQDPNAVQTPEGTGTPETVQTPNSVQTSNPAQPPNPTQSQAPALPEEDLSGRMSVEELTRNSAEVADATWCLMANAEPQTDPGWTFDTYYVNEENAHDVTKTSNFNLKYQMEFRTDRNLDPNAVQIRIDSSIYENRYGTKITPDDIGIPNGTPEKYTVNARTPFNYYYKEENETNYLVFFNYRTIPAGTNAAWQVLYKNQKLMDIQDGKEWNLTPQIFVENGTDSTEPEGERQPAPGYDSEKFVPKPDLNLQGKIDSWVRLTGVTKTPYSRQGVNYTPGLYTVSQLEQFITGKLDENSVYRSMTNRNRLNTDEYRFVVWDVKVTGEATQPWTLKVEDHPTVGGNPGLEGPGGTSANGTVVGWKDNSDRSTQYALPITVPENAGADPTLLTERKEESWGNRFYVVTAYPVKKDGEQVSSQLQNDITVTLDPVDPADPNVSVTSNPPATWNYQEYDWTYSGNVLGADKSTDSTITYTGWLDAYRSSRLLGEDYGSLPFTARGYMNGYGLTHFTSGDKTGEYKDGTYYTLITLDDFLSVSQSDNAVEAQFLTEDDYYYNSVTIKQWDRGYNVWDDEFADESDLKTISYERLPQGVFRQVTDETTGETSILSPVRIWAKFADSASQNGRVQKTDVDIYNAYKAGTAGVQDNSHTDSTPWELVATVYVDENGKMVDESGEKIDSYMFSEDLIAQHPYRIMVEHDTVDYRSECQIDTTVCMKATSPVMEKIIEARGDSNRNTESATVTIEALVGALGVAHGAGQTVYFDHGSSEYKDRGDLQAESLNRYGRLPYRKSAYRSLKWLTETAASYKTAKSTNDVEHSRVLVDYCLTAYDGYEIYSKESLDYLSETDKTLITPGRNHVVFYDLLPKGVSFDASYPVTAGRITNLDTNKDYTRQPRSWDTTQVEVKVDAAEIDANYRNTGRTLVVFRITYNGADATSYTGRKWIEGWGVSFRAYYDWKDIDLLKDKAENANLSAFMPDFQADPGQHPALHGLNGEVYFDNGEFGEDTSKANTYKDLVTEGKDKNGQIAGPGNIDGINLTDETTKQLYDTSHRNVLYANNVLRDGVATSYTSGIKTLVRADEDRFGAFTETAVVPTGAGATADGSYTYDITVEAGRNETGIVIFDRLENAAIDRINPDGTPYENEPFSFDVTSWRGDFQAVDVSGLKKMGVTNPVVYYSFEKDKDGNCNAPIPKDGEDPATVLNQENNEKKWYTEENIPEKYKNDPEGWQSLVTAVAVDLGDYTLAKDHSASIQIQMKAPVPGEGDPSYAYNNASYSSKEPNAEDSTRKTLHSSSVRVSRSPVQLLEVVKRFGGDVPSSMRNKSFSFYLYTLYEKNVAGKKETVEQPLAYAEYQLYKLENGEWKPQGNQIRSTDGSGILKLHADEKAVFKTANVAEIQVSEATDIFWDTNTTWQRSREETVNDTTTRVEDPNGDIRTATVTNTYRPVLYVEKELAGVPIGMVRAEQQLEGVTYESDPADTSKEKIKYIRFTEDNRDSILEKYEFEFQILTENDQPLANAEYWYVDSVRLDGGTPVRVDENGNKVQEGQSIQTAKTDEKGKFKIHAGQIIALFPGNVGTNYKLVETKDYSPDWTIEEEQSTVEGTLSLRGDSQTFTNYYKWKNLYVTKTIQDQTQDEYDAMEEARKQFTFHVDLVEEQKAAVQPGTPEVTLEETPEETPVESSGGTSGEPSVKAKASGRERTRGVKDGEIQAETTNPEEPVTVPAAHLKYQLLNADGTPVLENGSPVEGYLDANGEFTCALGFRKVRIIGLEEGRTYIVTEKQEALPKEGTKVLYQPVKDLEEVTMPVYSDHKDAELINRYLKRSLSVTKTVVDSSQTGTGGTSDGTSAGNTAADLEFTFLAEVNGTPLPVGTPYTVEKQGVVVRTAKIGITEENGAETEAGPAGIFTLKSGETATFKNVGFIGDGFEVWEAKVTDPDDPRAKYEQVVPSASEGSSASQPKGYEGMQFGVPGSDTFTEDILTAGVTFVNMDGTAGNLLISKEYVAADADSAAVVDMWRRAIKDNSHVTWEKNAHNSWVKWKEPWGITADAGYVKFSLEVTDSNGESQIWPRESDYTDEYEGVKCVKVQYVNQLNPEMSGEIYWPVGATISVLPWITIIVPGDKLSGVTTYTLREEARYQHHVIPLSKFNEDTFEIENRYIQSSQSYPTNDQAITGTVAEKPVATIVNELKNLNPQGSRIFKEMLRIENSDTSVDSKLVFRLEKYENENWIPASGISYVKLTKNAQNILISSQQTEITGEDGKIVLTNAYEKFLWTDGGVGIWFLNNWVFMNVYTEKDISEAQQMLKSANRADDPLLRLVELPEESSDEYGFLAGYTGWHTSGPGEDQTLFNSNTTSPVEIAKDMAEGYNAPDEPFTMILQQVVGMRLTEEFVNMNRGDGIKFSNIISMIVKISENEPLNDLQKVLTDIITATEPRAGIPYTVHDADGKVAGSDTTGPNGEIQLRAGQYVTLNLPDQTVWTVSENQDAVPNYKLDDLNPDPGSGNLIKLNSNLMLINMGKERTECSTKYYDIETGEEMKKVGINRAEELYVGDFKRLEPRESLRLYPISEDINSAKDYVFVKDAPGNVTELVLDADPSKNVFKLYYRRALTLSYNGNGHTLELQWLNKKDPAVNGKVKLPEESPFMRSASENEKYTFIGWKIGDAIYQPGETVTLTEDTTAYAQWVPNEITIDIEFGGVDYNVDTTSFLLVIEIVQGNGEMIDSDIVEDYKKTGNIWRFSYPIVSTSIEKFKEEGQLTIKITELDYDVNNFDVRLESPSGTVDDPSSGEVIFENITLEDLATPLKIINVYTPKT